MAELTHTTTPTCCSTEQQADCCEPQDKESCCTPESSSYRCAAAGAGFDEIEIREPHRVHQHASSAIIRARKPSPIDEH